MRIAIRAFQMKHPEMEHPDAHAAWDKGSKFFDECGIPLNPDDFKTYRDMQRRDYKADHPGVEIAYIVISDSDDESPMSVDHDSDDDDEDNVTLGSLKKQK